jgi:hypothetical protein
MISFTDYLSEGKLPETDHIIDAMKAKGIFIKLAHAIAAYHWSDVAKAEDVATSIHDSNKPIVASLRLGRNNSIKFGVFNDPKHRVTGMCYVVDNGYILMYNVNDIKFEAKEKGDTLEEIILQVTEHEITHTQDKQVVYTKPQANTSEAHYKHPAEETAYSRQLIADLKRGIESNTFDLDHLKSILKLDATAFVNEVNKIIPGSLVYMDVYVKDPEAMRRIKERTYNYFFN